MPLFSHGNLLRISKSGPQVAFPFANPKRVQPEKKTSNDTQMGVCFWSWLFFLRFVFVFCFFSGRAPKKDTAKWGTSAKHGQGFSLPWVAGDLERNKSSLGRHLNYDSPGQWTHFTFFFLVASPLI